MIIAVVADPAIVLIYYTDRELNYSAYAVAYCLFSSEYATQYPLHQLKGSVISLKISQAHITT